MRISDWSSDVCSSDLVRTSKESKQCGISFVLFDMASPGVSTKPILLISGNSPFCETFFDDVKVPKEQHVGEINRGWDVAKYLLGHEREMISGAGRSEEHTSELQSLIRNSYAGICLKKKKEPSR